jgi:sporulation-control protein spo0M
MPSIIPGYVYTLFASIIVGTLIIGMCGLSVASVKHDAEEQQLSTIASYVVAKSVALSSQAVATDFTLKLPLDLPSSVGNQRYWVRIQNDSYRTWVEVGYGSAALSTQQRAYIPVEVSASGVYVSGSGVAYLEYSVSASGAYLTLIGGM